MKKLGKNEEAATAIRRLVAVERGNPESLVELLGWLIEQKAWSAVEDLSRRFSARFAEQPILLYSLAEAYAAQGKKDQAGETAARAFKIAPGKQQSELLRHLMVAQHLRGRGLFDWAKREFEHVISQGAAANSDEVPRHGPNHLAEMFHDQGQDLDAAGTLEKLVADIKAGKVTKKRNGWPRTK